MTSKARVIYWFRTDLRLHDSPALTAALELDSEAFFPIWTWDPHYVYRARVGPNRWQFLTDCQRDLSESLTKLNNKQKLFVIREAPQTLFPKLFKQWEISHLVFEKDTDAYARDRDDQVVKLAREAGVEVIIKTGRTLFDPDELVKANGNKPTMSMSQVQHASAKLGNPARPIPSPNFIPDPGETDLSTLDHAIPSPQPDFNAVHRTSNESSYRSIMGPKKDFAVPTLPELGIPDATSHHRGGESQALSSLKSIIRNEAYTATFEKPKTAPTDFSPQATTLLSPHMHFGSLSVRKFYWDVMDVIEKRKKAGKSTSSIPVNLPGQLLFREMYFGAQAALGYKYAQAHGNPICRFAAWHLPSDVDAQGMISGTYMVDSQEAEHYFRRWKHGCTGFPFVDALMRQLKHDGWIHHLGRHMVACFLTRGGCYVHWERGAEVFEEWLLDHEVACNAGNWMWLSCTAFFSQFYRCYSPIAFGRKWDPEGNFIRHYVPELARYDKKYIYEPWKAPIADQKAWGCRIEGPHTNKNNKNKNSKGDEEEEFSIDLVSLYNQRDIDSGGKLANSSNYNNKTKTKTKPKPTTTTEEMKTYPKPMFDFSERREFCIKELKHAYDVGLHGDSEDVLSGKWKEIFGFEVEVEVDGDGHGDGDVDRDGRQHADEQNGKYVERVDWNGEMEHESAELGDNDAHTSSTTPKEEDGVAEAGAEAGAGAGKELEKEMETSIKKIAKTTARSKAENAKGKEGKKRGHQQQQQQQQSTLDWHLGMSPKRKKARK